MVFTLWQRFSSHHLGSVKFSNYYLPKNNTPLTLSVKGVKKALDRIIHSVKDE